MQCRSLHGASKKTVEARLAEHHTPKRDWMDRAFHAGPGGQRHSNLKD